jgi:hypothetical protein
MSDCPASSQSGTRINRNFDAGTAALYLNKGIPFGTGMLQYRTEIQAAGIPMPASSTSMPMPSYDNSFSDMSQAPFLLILQNEIIFPVFIIRIM